MTTEELMHLLRSPSVQLDNPEFHASRQHIFRRIVTDQMQQKNFSFQDLSVQSGISRSFLYQILGGDRLPSRDMTIRIAVALHLDVNETQQLLRCSMRGALYPRIHRDAVIIYGLNQAMTLSELDELLISQNEDTLL